MLQPVATHFVQKLPGKCCSLLNPRCLGVVVVMEQDSLGVTICRATYAGWPGVAAEGNAK